MEKELLLSYEEKAKYNDEDSLLFLSNYYYENDRKEDAFKLLDKLANSDNSEALRKLAFFYQNGIGTTQNWELAKYYYEKAYLLGDVVSGYNLAISYMENKEYLLAIPYLTNNRFEKHIPSIKVLGDMYRLGLGVEQNPNIAINLYQEAVDLGDSSLIDQIGVIYYKNNDCLNAFNYFTKGANILDKNALYHLAICYSKGEGTYRDAQKAIYYFELAAKQGNPKALYNLYLIYENGIGVNKDSAKAKSYLDKYENSKK